MLADEIRRGHADRPSCERRGYLTRAESDDWPWPLEVGSVLVDGGGPCFEDFGDEPFSAIEMKPGDAGLYRGIDLRHGRTQPNPNHWSAHLFLFWVERGGEFRSEERR